MSVTVTEDDRAVSHGTISKDVYEKLEQYIKNTRFGSVTLIIQDGRIIQIEKNEKVRFK
jgi:hypothetical protein